MLGPVALATIRTSGVLGLRVGVQACSLLLVARLLGPAQFGAFAGVTALALMLGTLSTFGTHLVLLGEVSQDPARRARVLPYALPMTLLCGSVLLAVFLVFCAVVWPEHGIGLGVSFAIGVSETLLQPFAALVVSELLAVERTARSQLLQTLPLTLRLIAAGVVFVWQPPDPLAAYGYSYCLATAIGLAAATKWQTSPWPRPSQWRWPTRSELGASVSFAVLNITAIGPAELDKTLAAKLLPLPAAGLYSAGARVVGAATLPVIALMLSVLPRLFREGRGLRSRSARLLRWIFGATFIYSMALAAVLWWCAPPLARLLGNQYEGVDSVIRWLCIAVPGMAMRIAAGNVLMALGKPWMRAGFEVTGLMVLAAVAVAMTVYVGPNGMPLALASSEWTMAVLGYGWAMRLRAKG